MVTVTHAGAVCLEAPGEYRDTGIAWGLGWGLETAAGTFFQWGDINNYKAFALGHPGDQSAIAIFTNGASGLSVMPSLMREFMPGDRPSLAWLDYAPHDAPERRLLREVLNRGLDATLPDVLGANLQPAAMMWIAHGLNAHGRVDEYRLMRSRMEKPLA